MKYIYPISELAHSIIGMIFVTWAYTRPASHLIMKRFGIRVASSKSYLIDGESHLEEVCEALMLLERFDSESLNLIKEYIEIIFLCPIGVEAGYYPIGNVCVLNLQTKSDENRLIKIAGFLVFFATFSKLNGRLKFLCGQNQENIKRGKEEQHRVIEKLNNALYSGK